MKCVLIEPWRGMPTGTLMDVAKPIYEILRNNQRIVKYNQVKHGKTLIGTTIKHPQNLPPAGPGRQR